MHPLKLRNAVSAAYCVAMAACGGSIAGSGRDSGAQEASDSGSSSMPHDGSSVQVDGESNADATEDYIIISPPPDGAGVSPDGFVPSCDVGGGTTCDYCLSNSCCLQVEACQVDPTCTSAMACLVKCESNGGSGLACAEGQCSKPADQQTTNLFTCGSQQCASPCYMN
jgi:hypothetical protein